MLCNTYTQIKITKQKHSKLVIKKFALSVTEDEKKGHTVKRERDIRDKRSRKTKGKLESSNQAALAHINKKDRLSTSVFIFHLQGGRPPSVW